MHTHVSFNSLEIYTLHVHDNSFTEMLRKTIQHESCETVGWDSNTHYTCILGNAITNCATNGMCMYMYTRRIPFCTLFYHCSECIYTHICTCPHVHSAKMLKKGDFFLEVSSSFTSSLLSTPTFVSSPPSPARQTTMNYTMY